MDSISLFIKENNLIRATISLAVSSIAYEFKQNVSFLNDLVGIDGVELDL